MMKLSMLDAFSSLDVDSFLGSAISGPRVSSTFIARPFGDSNVGAVAGLRMAGIRSGELISTYMVASILRSKLCRIMSIEE